MTFRCLLPAWIASWVAAIYLPSALIAIARLSAGGSGTGIAQLAASIWAVADEVAPAVKLMIGGLLLLGLPGLYRFRWTNGFVRLGAAIVTGMAVMLLTIALVPNHLSRGFAAALTGVRFDATLTLIYLIGGVVAGAAFVWTGDRCMRNRGNPPRGRPV